MAMQPCHPSQVLARRFGASSGWGFQLFHDEFIQIHHLPRCFFFDRYLTRE
jgi:hypothetical protein